MPRVCFDEHPVPLTVNLFVKNYSVFFLQYYIVVKYKLPRILAYFSIPSYNR